MNENAESCVFFSVINGLYDKKFFVNIVFEE